MNSDHAQEIKYALTDVRSLVERLGLISTRNTFVRQAGGVIMLCPWHQEKTPSCSVRIGGSGTIAVKCHGCGEGGDVLSLIAVARGLNLRSDFRDVLREGAELAGLWALADEITTGKRHDDRVPIPPPRATPEPGRGYPDAAELDALWNACTPTADDSEIRDWLNGRSLDPERIDADDLARAIPETATLPRWARFRGLPWSETGHRLLVPMRDANGALRTVRAGRVRDGETPKRLPPGGHKASEVVMADTFGVAMLRGERVPERVVIVEGEPDFWTWATRANDPRTAVLGIVSGSWCDAIRDRVPRGALVILRTDHDRAGDAYALAISESLMGRCMLRRSEVA